MKLMTSEEIKLWEQAMLTEKNISAAKLMEQASTIFCNWIDKKMLRDSMYIAVFCGWGNNGGDGYTIAKILHERNINVDVFTIKGKQLTKLCKKAKTSCPIKPSKINSAKDLSSLEKYDIVIDAILGNGGNRAFDSTLLPIIKYINDHANYIMSVDIPSGMKSEGITDYTTINANEALSFSLPKLSFFSSTNTERLGKWIYKPLVDAPEYLHTFQTSNYLLTRESIKGKLRQRHSFSHKGTYGHSLLIGSSEGKAGAISLAALAAYRTGSGLVTIGTSKTNRQIVQITLPESMYMNMGNTELTQFIYPEDTYAAVGIGPGMGTREDTITSFTQYIKENTDTLILDADALNIIAKMNLQDYIIPASVITPHPKEFDRLFGASNNDIERREKQRNYSISMGIYIVLKGAYSTISCPDGNIYYNSTGNAGMATGGSGDVLLGMITSYIAQGYEIELACKLAVHLHGLAGDLAAKDLGEEFMIASDIIKYISPAIKMIR